MGLETSTNDQLIYLKYTDLVACRCTTDRSPYGVAEEEAGQGQRAPQHGLGAVLDSSGDMVGNRASGKLTERESGQTLYQTMAQKTRFSALTFDGSPLTDNFYTVK